MLLKNPMYENQLPMLEDAVRPKKEVDKPKIKENTIY
jgi:hypothetical protein